MTSFQAAAGFPFADPDPSRAWAYLRLLSFRIETLLEAQRRNAAALTRANQAALDGIATMVLRQGELLNTTVETYRQVVRDALAAASFDEKARRQAEAARHLYDSTIDRCRELSDIATKTNVAAVDILSARMTEAFDELKALLAAPAEPVAALAAAPAVLAAPLTDVEDIGRGEAADTRDDPEPTSKPIPRTERAPTGRAVRAARRPPSRG
jgi:phasin family protein